MLYATNHRTYKSQFFLIFSTRFRIAVRLGSIYLDETKSCEECDPAIEYQIEKAIQHENYRNTEKFDIGLLKLVEDVEFTEQIKPICLPLKNENYFDSTKDLIIMGFGKSMEGPRSNVLMKANVPFVTLSDCERLNEKFKINKNNVENLNDGSFCAGNENKNACRGELRVKEK